MTVGRTISRRLAGLVLGLLAALPCPAAPVSAARASRAVSRWLSDRPAARMNARLGGRVSDVRTVTHDGEALFHVASLDGRGYVVTSADDEVEPVIAFSESGAFVESDENPLVALLRRDLPQRLKARRAGSVAASARRASRGIGRAAGRRAPAEDWAELSSEAVPRGLSSRGVVADVRVAPLVETRWGQGESGDRPCYNRCTPNGYVCGCVATAAAQLMRYHRHPTASVRATSQSCWIDGVKTSVRMMGGTYDWDDMPAVPSASGAPSDAVCEAIGKLCFDAGVASRMNWTSAGSGASDVIVARNLSSIFGYANARYAIASSLGADAFENAVYANLDARCPVLMGIDDGVSGHEVIADGYGVEGGTIYTHLNLGWAGSSDAWYALPSVSAGGYSFRNVSTVVYNVFAARTGELVTGRVLDGAGNPQAGVEVTARSGSAVMSVRTDEKGIYAFYVDSDTRYVLSADGGHLGRAYRAVKSGRSRNNTIESVALGGVRFYEDGEIGNRWGEDMIYGDSPAAPIVSLAINGPAKVMAASKAAYVCAATCADGSVRPVPATWSLSPFSADGIAAENGVLTTAKVSGMRSSRSVTLTATFADGGEAMTVQRQVSVVKADPRPDNDAFADATEVSGTSGTAAGDSSYATNEPGDPLTAAEGSAVSTLWWRWTAPFDGIASFSATGSSIRVILGVYQGGAPASLTELVRADATADKTCRFACTAGGSYAIGLAGYCGEGGAVLLSWQAERNTVIPTLEDLADVFADDPELLETVATPARLAEFNVYLKRCGITSAASITPSQRRWASRSYALAPLVTSPELFESEPRLAFSAFGSRGATCALTVSLTVGTRDVPLRAAEVASRLRFGTDVRAIDRPVPSVVVPAEDGVSPVFPVATPEVPAGFFRIGEPAGR